MGLSQLGARGFRPFFLLAGLFGAVIAPLWVWGLTGGPTPAGPLSGVRWHAHEMIFGFTVAVISGFLLTAVENWTKRPTLRGPALLGVAAIWLAARIALWVPGALGSILDLWVLPLVAGGIARPLWATRNLRNLPFVGLLGALWIADLAVHLDAWGLVSGVGLAASRAAVYVVVVIVLVVAGRIVPLFTRNVTGIASLHDLPVLDRIAVGATGVLAVLQLTSLTELAGLVALVAGGAVLGRTWGWWTSQILGQPLLWVLHLGHASVGVGLLLSGLSLLGVATGSGPLHLITVGGVGLLTIGMMARVSLGHTGRPIQAGRGTALALGAIGLAALARGVGPWVLPAHTVAWLWGAATLWLIGFASLVIGYAPILLAPRADGRDG